MNDTMMTDRRSWRDLFEFVNLGRRTQSLTIEVLDEELGDQTQVVRMPFEYLEYDDRSDVIVVASCSPGADAHVVLRHLIHGPRTVDLLEREDDALVIRVVDGTDVETLLTLQP